MIKTVVFRRVFNRNKTILFWFSSLTGDVDQHSFFAFQNPAVFLQAGPDLALQNCGVTF